MSKNWIFFIISIISLWVIGVVMISSTIPYDPSASAENPYKKLFLHLGYSGVGFLAFLIGSFIRYQKWRDWSIVFPVISFFLLLFCFPNPLFDLGEHELGERRRIIIPFIDLKIQPSEIAKFFFIVLLGAWLCSKKVHKHAKNPIFNFLIPLVFIGFFIAPILLQTDIGTSAVMYATALGILYCAGANSLLVLGLATSSFFAGLSILKIKKPDRWERILLWREGGEYQQMLSIKAYQNGDFLGVGLGNSDLKDNLPLSHTDFIAPILGEELGLLGSLILIACFATLFLSGVKIARHAPDKFGQILGLGIVLMISIQALLNLCIATSLLPNSGLPLPLISYGGTNLIMTLFMLGVMINIYHQQRSSILNPS